MKNKRDVSLDFLKILSMAAVVFLHTQRNAGLGMVFNPILYYGSRFAMPVFFMINGMLILDHEEYSFQYYKRKIINMIRITVIWGIITAIYSFFFEGSLSFKLPLMVLGVYTEDTLYLSGLLLLSKLYIHCCYSLLKR